MRPETGFALRDLWPVSRWKWAGNRVHPAGRSQIQCWRKLPLSDAGLLFFKDPLDGSTEREPLLLTSEEESRLSPADAAGRTGPEALWRSCSVFQLKPPSCWRGGCYEKPDQDDPANWSPADIISCRLVSVGPSRKTCPKSVLSWKQSNVAPRTL